MTEIILAGWLTPIFYIFLFALTVWVVTHGLEILSHGSCENLDPLQREACTTLNGLSKAMELKVRGIEGWAKERAMEVRSCETLEEATDLLSEVFPEVNKKKVKELAGKVLAAEATKDAQQLLLEEPLPQVHDEAIKVLLGGLKQNRDMGPGNDMVAWFENQEIPSAVMEYILGEEGGGEPIQHPERGSRGGSFLSDMASEYNWRLSTSARIAPIAGMAPTMTGAMEFLGDYSSSLKEGSTQLPLSGLNTALFTTCWGCCLTIASVVLLSYLMKRKIPRARKVVQRIKNPIMEAVNRWKAVVERSSGLGNWGSSNV